MMMNVLAFAFHTQRELGGAGYRLIRTTVGTRRRFFQHLEALVCYWQFERWPRLMDYLMMRGREIGPNA